MSDLAEEPIERLAGLRGQGFQSPELGRLEIVQVARHLEYRLDLCQRSPGCVEIPPVLTRASLRTALCDVQGHAVGDSTELVRQCVLLVIREPTRCLHALDGKAFRMLPSLEVPVRWHENYNSGQGGRRGTKKARVA